MSQDTQHRPKIELPLFMMAFDPEIWAPDAPTTSAYLDRYTGEITWVYCDDFEAEMDVGVSAEQNQMTRQQVESMPNRFLYIPGISQKKLDEIFKEFFDSEWFANDNTRSVKADPDFESIADWKSSVDKNAAEAFDTYRERRTIEIAKEFLQSHGIEPNWK